MKQSIQENRENQLWQTGGTFFLLFLFFLLLLVWNINTGSVKVSTEEIIKILFYREGNETTCNIIWKIRLPRVFTAAILGGALALAGFLLQTFFNNPIAGPYILGISSGAKLTVALSMIYIMGRGRLVYSGFLIIMAFLGSMLSMGFVLLISGQVSRASMLIVAGVMIGYICSAVTDFIITFADDADIVNLHNWSMGSFSGMAWEDVGIMATVVLAAAIIVFFLSKPIGAYQLGEAYAQNMGVNIRFLRMALICLSSLLSACVTAFAGPISFVGIAVPHIIKLQLHTSKPILMIPACFLGGSVFCMMCDLIARTCFAPSELSISSVTAVFGAPVVIVIMIRKNRKI